MHRLRRSREEALATGQALGALGLVVHVVQEHPFLDRDLCYRLAWSDPLDRIDVADLWHTAEQDLPAITATRSYRGARRQPIGGRSGGSATGNRARAPAGRTHTPGHQRVFAALAANDSSS